MSYGGSGELTQSDGSGELTQSDECYERYSTRPTRPHQVTYSQIAVSTNCTDGPFKFPKLNLGFFYSCPILPKLNLGFSTAAIEIS